MNLDNITIKNLRIFVDVVESDGIKPVAEKTLLTKSTIYGHLRGLEIKTGVKLFYEIINRRNLTPSGREMYDMSIRLLDIVDNEMKKLK